jgi:hypothetical protein
MTPLWIITAIVAAAFLLILADILRSPTDGETQETGEPLTAEEMVSAAVELDAIHRRLDVAWCHHELRDEAHRLRRELDAELRRVDALEAGKPGE